MPKKLKGYRKSIRENCAAERGRFLILISLVAVKSSSPLQTGDMWNAHPNVLNGWFVLRQVIWTRRFAPLHSSVHGHKCLVVCLYQTQDFIIDTICSQVSLLAQSAWCEGLAKRKLLVTIEAFKREGKGRSFLKCGMPDSGETARISFTGKRDERGTSKATMSWLI